MADTGLTGAEAGVDIDAGNALVAAIKPLVRATRRAGADADLGGFGGLFDLKAAGYKDPILVAANDGVGTKLKIAIETGQHATIGVDLVAMCVNDLLAQGAEPLFFLDYFATGKLDVAVAREVIANAIRVGKFALIRPVTTSTEGRCVATTRWMPVARASCASLHSSFSTSNGAAIIRSASSSITTTQ